MDGSRQTRLKNASIVNDDSRWSAVFWLTINPSDINSPVVMHYAGHPIDLASACLNQMPNCADRLRTVANDPVAVATFFTRRYRLYSTAFFELALKMVTVVCWGKSNRTLE